MTVLATTASVQFATGGVAEVESTPAPDRPHLHQLPHLRRSAPILAIDDAHVQVSITVPDTQPRSPKRT